MTHPGTRRLVGLLYVVGLLMAVDQAADLLTTLLSAPQAPNSAQWRFGVFGMVASRVAVFLVAEVLVFAAALVLEHRTTLRLLGAFNVLIALAALAALGFFALDTLELRRGVGADRAGVYDAAAFRAGAIALLGTIVLAWSGVIALRSSRDEPGRRRKGSPPIVEAPGPRGRSS